MFPESAVPIHVPPDWTGVKITGFEFLQTTVSDKVKLALGIGSTVMVLLIESVQPYWEYLCLIKNVPVSEGLKVLPLRWMLPLKLPPVLIGFNRILVAPLQTLITFGMKSALGFVNLTMILSFGNPHEAV